MTTATAENTAVTHKTPWAGLTKAFAQSETVTSQELLEQGGLDFEVGIRPLYRTLRDGTVVVASHDREVFIDDKAMGILDELQLGTVRTRYTPLRNREIFAFGDHLVESGDGTWHAAGMQNNFSRAFMIMKLSDEFTVAGEAHQMFLSFRTAHDGSGAIRVDAMPFRLAGFSDNQIKMSGVAGVSSSWRVIHTTNLATRIAEAELTIAQAAAYRDAYVKAAEKLAEVKLTTQQGAKLIQKIIKKGRTRRDDVIEDITQNWLTSTTIPDEYRFTGWGLLNAVTEYFGHICDRRGDGNSLYESIMTGEAAKARDILVRSLS